MKTAIDYNGDENDNDTTTKLTSIFANQLNNSSHNNKNYMR